MTLWTGENGEDMTQGIAPAGPQGIVPMVIETGREGSVRLTSIPFCSKNGSSFLAHPSMTR